MERMVSMSRIAPSMTIPASFRWRHDSLASSPQMAGPWPQASTMMTSPGFATSMASTGLAQSPGNVRTVTAGPMIFLPGVWSWIPGRSPDRCIASERLGVETFSRIARISASELPRL